MLNRSSSERDFKRAQYSNRKSLEIVLSNDIIKKRALDLYIDNSIKQLGSSLIAAALKGEKKIKVFWVDNNTMFSYKDQKYYVRDLIQGLGTDYLDKVINFNLEGYGYKIKKKYSKNKGIYQVTIHWK